MAEYKLSYTGAEIDEKLGKVDRLVATVNGTAPDENGNVNIAVSGNGTVDLTGYATEAWVETGFQPKGDYLTEHQKLKTINGVSLVGEGNIEISGNGGETSVQQAYVSVKYLENTGTQYIDTGYVIQEDDEITVDYEIPAESL